MSGVGSRSERRLESQANAERLDHDRQIAGRQGWLLAGGLVDRRDQPGGDCPGALVLLGHQDSGPLIAHSVQPELDGQHDPPLFRFRL
jgi:hypothetical protein